MSFLATGPRRIAPSLYPMGVSHFLEETGDSRNVPQFFDGWKLVNVPSVPSFPDGKIRGRRALSASMSGQQSHAHHYVPQWYQRRFLLPGQSRYYYLDMNPDTVVRDGFS